MGSKDSGRYGAGVGARVPVELREALEDIAVERDWTLNQVVRDALRRYVGQETGKPVPAEQPDGRSSWRARER